MDLSSIWHDRQIFLNNAYRDFDPHSSGRQILLRRRVSADGRKIIVRTPPEHIFFAPPRLCGMILDFRHALKIKARQVSDLQHDYSGKPFCEVLLSLDEWFPAECGPFDNFDNDPASLDFDKWRKTAKAQQKAGNFPEAWEFSKEDT